MDEDKSAGRETVRDTIVVATSRPKPKAEPARPQPCGFCRPFLKWGGPCIHTRQLHESPMFIGAAEPEIKCFDASGKEVFLVKDKPKARRLKSFKRDFPSC